jgi:hypothetical protein
MHRLLNHFLRGGFMVSAEFRGFASESARGRFLAQHNAGGST